MDEQQSVANDINKILRVIASMSNKLEDLSSRVQHMEEELQKIQKNQPEFPLISDEEPQEETFVPPPFPENIEDLDVFCEWVANVENFFEENMISQYKQVPLIVSTLPSEEGGVLSWWKQIYDLDYRIDKYYMIKWKEMKKMLMVRYLSPDCLETNKSPPLKNIN
ncbi:uncharacterized protein LOC111915525 [Lactuca sativa]|uniref:Retrotransposon gag domain-containing protein n=1 Tax=Lactuca sativa TaxID=4236 RepID=A0A9R1XWJ4_LACSA|nr:uncharacterized protein LOC111915525 [Lactuca sativa]KAJ0224689.1 hypothetical protein LSAT_V11C100042820 [Lactuca sativa]